MREGPVRSLTGPSSQPGGMPPQRHSPGQCTEAAWQGGRTAWTGRTCSRWLGFNLLHPTAPCRTATVEAGSGPWCREQIPDWGEVRLTDHAPCRRVLSRRSGRIALVGERSTVGFQLARLCELRRARNTSLLQHPRNAIARSNDHSLGCAVEHGSRVMHVSWRLDQVWPRRGAERVWTNSRRASQKKRNPPPSRQRASMEPNDLREPAVGIEPTTAPGREPGSTVATGRRPVLCEWLQPASRHRRRSPTPSRHRARSSERRTPSRRWTRRHRT